MSDNIRNFGIRSLHSPVTSQPKTIGNFTAYFIKYECASQPGNLYFLRLQLTVLTANTGIGLN